MARRGNEARLGLVRFTQLLCARLQRFEQPDILKRHHRLVGNGGRQLDFAFRKWPPRLPQDHQDADRSAFPHERDGHHRAISASLERVMQLRIILPVDDMNNLSLQQCAAHAGVPSRTDRKPIQSFPVLRPMAERRRDLIGLARWAPDACTVSRAKPGSQVNQPIEQLLKIEAGAADLLEHLGESSLLLERFLQLVRPLFDPFLELPAGYLEPFSRVPQFTGTGRELVVGVLQLLLGAPAHLDVGTQGHAGHRNADEEHDQQEERIIEADPREGAAARQGPPHGKATQNDDNRRGLARVTPQRRP